MALTYTAIETVTLSSAQSSITFSVIPQTYTDLTLLVSARGASNTNSGQIWYTIAFNGSTSNFTCQFVQYDYNSAAAGTGTTIFGLNNLSNFTASTFASNSHYIPNYAGSTYKPISSDLTTETNSSDGVASLMATLWSDTSPITSITLTPQFGNFAQYSTATLYGIKNTV